MNIVLVDIWRTVNSKGGAEKVLFNMANALHRKGHHVWVIGCDPVDGQPLFPIDKGVVFINSGNRRLFFLAKKTEFNC